MITKYGQLLFLEGRTIINGFGFKFPHGTESHADAARKDIIEYLEKDPSVVLKAEFNACTVEVEQPPGPEPAPPSPNVQTAKLQSEGYLPYYKPTLPTTDQGSVVPYPGTVAQYMPGAGERADIGYLPEWTVRAIILGDSSRAAEQTKINADAAAIFPWHIDDADTGAPLSLDTHTNVSIDPRFSKNVVADPNKSTMTAAIDDAHQPQLTYFSFLKTGDLKYLRELQYQANWHMFSHGSSRGLGLLNNSQMRGFAWTLRQIALAAVATRYAENGTSPIPGLLPSNYFDRKLENNRRWLEEQTILSINPMQQAFRIMFPNYNVDTGVGLWQSDFITGVIGQIVRLGFSQWKPIFDWGMRGVKTRALGVNGWTKAETTGYYLKLRADANSPIVLTWGELAQLNGFDSSATVLGPNPVGGYISYVIGNLAIAASLGDAEALAGYNRLVTEIKGNFSVKWAFDPAIRPVVLKQPLVSADPHYNPFQIKMEQELYKAPNGGFFTVVSTKPGQTVVSPFPKHIGRVLSMSNYAHVGNASAGGGFDTNADFIDFGAGDIFDVKAGVWKAK